MSIKNVLIIDDEPDIRELLDLTLKRMGLRSRSVGSVSEAKDILSQEEFDLCLTDMRLPDGDGLEIVEFIQQNIARLPVAVITAYGNVEAAVQSLKAGAFDFVSKPVDLHLLRRLVNAALKLAPDQPVTETAEDQSLLLGNSAVIETLRGTIKKLVRSQAPVYIHGESGTGKEVVAREIHRHGPRSDHPFIAVNCGAIPSELMESEFFGYKKGAFTGANTDKNGLFVAADGGTLFLDEVADLPLSMQVKLLRAIQERAIKPIGETEEQRVDVRILSASHKDLASEVAAGHFRQDLFYRLNVIELKVPPLRDRTEDIPLLATHFLSQISQRWETPMAHLDDAAFEKLMQYRFPGNVRELENILERAATLCDGAVIHSADLQLPDNAPDEPLTSAPEGRLREELASQEQAAILKALEETRWNKTASAKKLGMTLRQLRYRLKKFGIE
ncbi:MAG: sigma-54-dependent transcriptional regulator [Thiotrichales bacterium]